MYGRFQCWEGDLITRQLQDFSAHTRNELAMLKSFIKPGDHIVDIGAHIGTFAVPFASFIQNQGAVYSFEANPENFGLLSQNIHLNNLDNIIHPVHAVVSTQDDADFQITLPEKGNSGMFYYSEADQDSGRTIKSINIDSWYQGLAKQPAIRLIKVDVEGAEVPVLQSCKNLIYNFKPILYLEINGTALNRFDTSPNDVAIMLEEAGYHFFRNIGERNSNNDRFEIKRLRGIEEGGKFYDLLAIHPDDERYPANYLEGFSLMKYLFVERIRNLSRRALKKLGA